MKITKRDANLLLFLAALVIFFLLYFFGYSTIQSETTALEQQLNSVRPQLIQLEEYSRNVAFYQEEIETTKAYVEGELTRYPADVKEEDYLVWLLAHETATGQQIETVSIQEPQLVTSFAADVPVDGEIQTTEVSVYRIPAQVTGSMSYAQLKESLDYVYAAAQRTCVDSVMLAYDATSGQLSANVNLVKFILSYPGAQYVQSTMPNLPLGQPNPFGTFEPAAPTETVEPQA